MALLLQALNSVQKSEGGIPNSCHDSAVFQIKVCHFDRPTSRFDDIRLDARRQALTKLDDHPLHQGIARSLNIGEYRPAELDLVTHGYCLSVRIAEIALGNMCAGDAARNQLSSEVQYV